jgi:cytochrome c biogenesis protein CcmG, thiol:disulfide interchange protein DsbE
MNSRSFANAGRTASLLAALALPCGCAGRQAAGSPAPAPGAPGSADPGGERAQLQAPAALMDVRLTDLTGDSIRMADLRGQVTVIAMWATWCKPCLLELPLLDAVRRRYADDPGVSVVAVSIDEVASAEELGEVQATVERLGLQVPVYLDQTGQVARHLMGAIRSVPLLAILDRDLHMVRERGFDTATDEPTYVAAKSALIELARKGELPAGEPGTPDDPETRALVTSLRRDLRRAYPELSEERIEELLADLEERMLYARPRPRPR